MLNSKDCQTIKFFIEKLSFKIRPFYEDKFTKDKLFKVHTVSWNRRKY